MTNLALILFLPWFALLAVLFWCYPRQPRGGARRTFDCVALLAAFAVAFLGMRWGYALGRADAGSGAIWKQVLANLVAYGAFLLALALAVPLRSRWLQSRRGAG